MNLKQLRKISEPMHQDLEQVYAKYGLKLRKRSGSVKEALGIVRFRYELVDIHQTDKAGNTTTPEAEAFKKYATAFGLEPDMLGRSFTLNDTAYTITGLRLSAKKKPVLIERCLDGKTFVIEVVRLRAAYGAGVVA